MDKDIAGQVKEFFLNYRPRKYTKGQILILSGDQTDYVYYLVSGKVKQYDVTYRGDEIILNVFKPGAFFPMSLAINKTMNPYIYEAETDIEIRQAPADEVVEFLHNNPDVTFDLLSRLYKGIDGLLGRMAYLMAGSAKSRVLYELLIEAKRFGQAQDKGFLLNISEKDLGARAGLSRETISREIHKLKTDNIIITKDNRLFINNLNALEKKLGQEV